MPTRNKPDSCCDNCQCRRRVCDDEARFSRERRDDNTRKAGQSQWSVALNRSIIQQRLAHKPVPPWASVHSEEARLLEGEVSSTGRPLYPQVGIYTPPKAQILLETFRAAFRRGTHIKWASLVVEMVKNLLTMWETWIRALGRSPGEGMATHSSIPV